MNLRERCSSRLAQLQREIEMLHPDDFDGEELLTYAREAAAQVERFVKQLDITPKDWRLVSSINALKASGLPNSAAEALHAVRKAANAGKHDPTSVVALLDLRRLLHDARAAVDQVTAPGFDKEEPAARAHVYGIVVADYPTGGEVDYEVCKLLDDGRIVTLDRYQLRYTDEDAVVEALEATGVLDRVPSTSPAELLRSVMAESHEFSGIWLYEGSLRDIALAFSSRQHSEAIPSLRREHSPSAVRAAAAMAAVDVGLGAASADAIAAELNEVYAMPSGRWDPYVERVAALVSAARGPELDGPRFVSSQRFALVATTALAHDDELRMAVSPDGVLFVDVGPGYQPMP